MWKNDQGVAAKKLSTIYRHCSYRWNFSKADIGNARNSGFFTDSTQSKPDGGCLF
jgi:hypothetical protein